MQCNCAQSKMDAMQSNGLAANQKLGAMQHNWVQSKMGAKQHNQEQSKMGAKQHNQEQSKMDAMHETGHKKKWVQ